MKPCTAWAVVSPKGHMRWGTINKLRADALYCWTLTFGRHWPYWYRRGWRCVKVEIKEVEK